MRSTRIPLGQVKLIPGPRAISPSQISTIRSASKLKMSSVTSNECTFQRARSSSTMRSTQAGLWLRNRFPWMSWQ